MISFREIAARMDPVIPPSSLRGSTTAWMDENNPEILLLRDKVIKIATSLPTKQEIGFFSKTDKGLLRMHRWPSENNPFNGKKTLSLRDIGRRHENPEWTFKFLWYNTWLMRTGVGFGNKPLLDTRRHEIGKAIADRNYHIVGLCEVWDEDERKVIKEEIGKKYYYEFARGSEHPVQLSSGLLTFGIDKAGIVSYYRQVFEEEGGGVDSYAEKGMLYTEIELRVPGSSFKPCIDLFITHLHAEEKETRGKQVVELVNFIKKHRKPENPVIVAGDFNISSLEKTGGEYALLLYNMASIDMEDIWLSRGGLAGGTSINADDPEKENPDYTPVCEFDATSGVDFCTDYPKTNLSNDKQIPGKKLDYVFVEQAKTSHSILIDVPRIRRTPFWRGPYSPMPLGNKKFYDEALLEKETVVPNFMSDHLGIEMDLVITPMSEIINN